MSLPLTQQRQRQLFMALWNDERSCSLTPSLLQRERLACSLAAHWHTLKGNTPQLTPQMAGCCAMTGVVLHSIICPSRAVACKTPSPWSLFAMGMQFDYEDCVWNPVNGRAKTIYSPARSVCLPTNHCLPSWINFTGRQPFCKWTTVAMNRLIFKWRPAYLPK